MKSRLVILACLLTLIALSSCRTASASALSQESPSAATSAAPQVDAKVEAAAKDWFHRFQNGDIDRTQLSDNVKDQITPAIVQKLGALLQPLGEPTGFVFTGSQRVDGATVYTYVLTFSLLKVTETIAFDGSGKVAGIFFKPETNLDLRGSDVEQAITAGLVPFVQSQGWGLSIGEAKCPDRIDLSKGPGHCTLTVGGIALPIHVVYDKSIDKWKANFDGQLFERTEVETSAQAMMLSAYDIRSVAKCDMPVIELIDPGSFIHCNISGTPKATSVTLKTLVDGEDGFYLVPIAGLGNVLPFVDVATTAHRNHSQVLLSGGQLDEFVDRWVTSEGRRGTVNFGKSRCPDPADLTGQKSVVCVVPLGGQDMRYKVWIDDEQGFEVRVQDAAIGKDLVEQYLVNSIRKQLPANETTQSISVNCGDKSVIVAPVSGSFSCSVLIAGEKGTVRVVVENEDGGVHFEDLQMDDDKSTHRK